MRVCAYCSVLVCAVRMQMKEAGGMETKGFLGVGRRVHGEWCMEDGAW